MKKIFLILFLFYTLINTYSYAINTSINWFFNVTNKDTYSINFTWSENIPYKNCLNWNFSQILINYNLTNWKYNIENWNSFKSCYQQTWEFYNWKFLKINNNKLEDLFINWSYYIWWDWYTKSFLNSFYLFNPTNWKITIYTKSILNINRKFQKSTKIDWLKNFLNRIKAKYNKIPKNLWFYIISENIKNLSITGYNQKIINYIQNHTWDFLDLGQLWSKNITLSWWINATIKWIIWNPYYYNNNKITNDIELYWIKDNSKNYTIEKNNWLYKWIYYDNVWTKKYIKYFDYIYYLTNNIYRTFKLSDLNNSNFDKTLVSNYSFNWNRWLYYITFVSLKQIIDWINSYNNENTDNLLEWYWINYWLVVKNDSLSWNENNTWVFLIPSFYWTLNTNFITYYRTLNDKYRNLKLIISNYFKEYWTNLINIPDNYDNNTKVIDKIKQLNLYWSLFWYKTIWNNEKLWDNLYKFLKIWTNNFNLNINYEIDWNYWNNFFLNTIWTVWYKKLINSSNLKRKLFVLWWNNDYALVNVNNKYYENNKYKYIPDLVYKTIWKNWLTWIVYFKNDNWDNWYDNTKISYVTWKNIFFDKYIKVKDYLWNSDTTSDNWKWLWLKLNNTNLNWKNYDFTWVNWFYSLWWDFENLYLNWNSVLNDLNLSLLTWNNTFLYKFWVLYSWNTIYNNQQIQWLKQIDSNIKYNTYLNYLDWNRKVNKFVSNLQNWLWLSNNLSISWYIYSLYDKDWNKKNFDSVWFDYDNYWIFNKDYLTYLWYLTWDSLNNLYTKLESFNYWLKYLIWWIAQNKIQNQFTLSNVKINNFKLNRLNWKFNFNISISDKPWIISLSIFPMIKSNSLYKKVNWLYAWFLVWNKNITNKNGDWTFETIYWSWLISNNWNKLDNYDYSWFSFIWDNDLLIWNQIYKSLDQLSKWELAWETYFKYSNFNNWNVQKALYYYLLKNIILWNLSNYSITSNNFYKIIEKKWLKTLIWYLIPYNIYYYQDTLNKKLYLWIFIKELKENYNSKDDFKKVWLFYWFVFDDNWNYEIKTPKYIKEITNEIRSFNPLTIVFYKNNNYYLTKFKNIYETNQIENIINNSYTIKKWKLILLNKNTTVYWKIWQINPYQDEWSSFYLNYLNKYVNLKSTNELNNLVYNIKNNDWFNPKTNINEEAFNNDPWYLWLDNYLENETNIVWETKAIFMIWSDLTWLTTKSFLFNSIVTRYPSVWLIFDLNDYKKLWTYQKYLKWISYNWWLLNNFVDYWFTLNWTKNLLDKNWVLYNTNNIFLNWIYNIPSSLNWINFDQNKWKKIELNFTLFDNLTWIVNNWEIKIQDNKLWKLIKNNLITASLNCWVTNKSFLKEKNNNLYTLIYKINSNDKLDIKNCKLSVGILIPNIWYNWLTINEIKKLFSDFQIILNLDWFKYWKYIVKNKYYVLNFENIKNNVITTLNNLSSIPKCKLFLIWKDWSTITNWTYNSDDNMLYWYVLFNNNWNICNQYWCKKILWTEINIQLNWWWKFINTSNTYNDKNLIVST